MDADEKTHVAGEYESLASQSQESSETEESEQLSHPAAGARERKAAHLGVGGAGASSHKQLDRTRVVLNVGGKRFETLSATLASKPNTLLGAMFAPRNKQLRRTDKNGEYFFDRDPDAFQVILNFYRTGRICIPPNFSKELLEIELDFFQIRKKAGGNRIYAWGRGDAGQLGRGDRASCRFPRLVQFPRGLKIVQISLGTSHSGALTEAGEVYSWGNGSDGRLGLSNDQADAITDVLSPTKIRALEGIVITQIVCGEIHTAAVTDKGELFTWGLGKNGRLGHGNTLAQTIPKKVENLVGQSVTQVSCGGLHTAALTDNDRCYSWGSGKFGRLGLGDESDALTPRSVPSLSDKNLKQVLCGGHHTMALTSDGDVYSWGYDDDGRLGHGMTGNQLIPKPIDTLHGKNVIQVAAGCWHSAAVTSRGVVYTWGSCKSGQLGLPRKMHSFNPCVVFQGARVSQISCGTAHTAILTERGLVYTWGKHDDGRLGYRTDDTDQQTPRRVESLEHEHVVGIVCGVSDTAVLCR